MSETENQPADNAAAEKQTKKKSSIYIPFLIVGGLMLLFGLWSYFNQPNPVEEVAVAPTEMPEQVAEIIEATPIPVVEATLPPPTATVAPTETAVPPTNTPIPVEPTPTDTPPTATPEPLPTATPAPEPIIIEIVVPRLKMRAAPSTEADTILTLTDELSPFIGIGRNEDGTWMQVQLTDGQIGWVSSQYITSERNPFAVLPIIDPNAPVVVEETAVIETATENTTAETDTPTLTPEPTRQITTIPTISIMLVELNVPRLVLRERPSVDAAAVVTLTQEIFPPRAMGRNPEGTWIEVLLDDGRMGWLSAEFLTIGGDPQSLPMTE